MHDRLTLALWLIAAYLLLMYAALRWGAGHPATFPGSD
jgi:hypothetical protein